MKSTLLGAILGACVVCLGIVSCTREQPEANAQPGATSHKWEYKIVYVESWGIPENPGDPKSWEKEAPKLSGRYTELGADGWEYVGAHRGASVYAIFKRPKK